MAVASSEVAGGCDARWRRAARHYTRCVMVLPDDLAGKRVLDLECRKGLGAFKIADRVGREGFVIGTDSSAERIAAAVGRAPQQHWAGEDWRCHMRLVQADPSDLRSAGIEGASVDVVVINSVLNLMPDQLAVLREIARVLAPGGYLYHDAVLALQPVPVAVARACSEADDRAGEHIGDHAGEHIGEHLGGHPSGRNVFAVAPTRGEFEALLREAGFARWESLNKLPLEPQRDDANEALAGLAFESAVVRAFV